MAFNPPMQPPGNWGGGGPSGPGYGGLGDPYYASNNNSFSNYGAVMQNKNISVDSFQSNQRVLSDAETIDLFHNAMYTAREEAAPEGKNKSDDAIRVKMLTLDFKRSGIGALPEEAVDIMKRDVAMIVLSHNHLTELPQTFAQCTKLTYLNLRANGLESFPPPLLKLQLLHILDLSRNKLESLPDEIINMKSLRVLSVSNNVLSSLPYSLGDMESLKILKLSGNPFNESILNLLKAEEKAASSGVPVAEHENDARVTSAMKKFLRSEAAAVDSGGESSESPIDTPRPLKGNLRFPVNPAAASGSKSPGPSKPAVPNRSHYRVTSGQSNTSQPPTNRRPSGAGSTGGSEKGKPSGESNTPGGQNSRNRRMGYVPKQPQLALDDAAANRNSLHLRGTSYNSGLKSKPGQHARNMSGAGSNSSADFDRGQNSFFHRLSSLPEQRSNVAPFSAATEGAKSLLFSLHSLHPYLSSLLHLASADSTRRSSLERVFYNSSNQLEALDQALQALHENLDADENYVKQQEQNVRRACKACLVAYAQVGKLLVKNAQLLVANADPRYLRMLLVLIYGSTIEAGNAYEAMNQTSAPNTGLSQTIPVSGDQKHLVPKLTVPSLGPANERAMASRRVRQPVENHEKSSSLPQSAVPLNVNGQSRTSSRSNSRSNIRGPQSAAMPRSADAFPMPRTPAIPTGDPPGIDTTMTGSQDALYEKILRSFQKAADETQQVFGKLSSELDRRLERAKSNSENKSRVDMWTRLASHARGTLNLCQNLVAELSSINASDTEKRNTPDFWQRVVKVFRTFVDFCEKIQIARTSYRGEMILNEAQKAVRPCYRSFRVAAGNLEISPWGYALSSGLAGGEQQQLAVQTKWPSGNTPPMVPQTKTNGHQRAAGSSGSGSSPFNTIPTTPLSAALGPAAAATMPPNSSHGSFDRSFQGDVFQRAAYALNQHHVFRRNG